jgi:hypothetical protein
MEINITKFFNESDAFEFAASACELGENAGPITWNNALKQGKAEPILTTPEELDAMCSYAKSSGGWTKEEIAEWTKEDINALFIQFVSGSIREAENVCSEENGEIDWTQYEKLSNEGTLSGNLYRGDSGEIFYYLGG